MGWIAKVVFVLVGLLTGFSIAWADEGVYKDASGVSIKFDDDGTDWEKIYSVGESTLTFNDANEVSNAKKKATLRAKANISSFLNETIKTESVLNSLTNTVSEVDRDENVTANRKTAEELIERIVQSSSSILKGVITLEEKVDVEKNLVTVMVGVSRKTMNVSDSVKNSITTDSSQQGHGGTSIGEPAQSEVGRSKNYDDF